MTYIFSNSTFTKLKLVLISLFVLVSAMAQTPELPATNAEEQMENNTENTADVEMEDDTYQQQLLQYKKEPINLNTADENELASLKLLTPLQIQNFISYRNILGNIINMYELQAIPGWGIILIQKIKPYIFIGNSATLFTTIQNRLKDGEYTLLARVSQTLQRSKGYVLDSSAATNYYTGSPQKILLRYKYQYKNLLQYGVVGEKDAGEQFFRGKQKKGFDFYSAHFFARNIGHISAIALGDFTVNMGQGLTQWQSLAFKKSADVLNIKRESSVLRPYNSAGEINFQRGAGITIIRKRLETTVFASYRKLDANLISDTSQTVEDYISSLQTSGYHRTKSEIDDKGIQRQLSFGGNISYKYKVLHLGVNAVQYKFKLPINKGNEPYNIYALNGSAFGNYSLDYSYTYKNLHFFGETATNNTINWAFLNGMLVSVAADVDMSVVYRNISPGYQSLYTNAFTENTYPTNEKGWYAGLSIHPGVRWRLDAYADYFQFPWLKFGVDAPTAGADYLVQLTYKPNKQLEIYSRFRSASKSLNSNTDDVIISPVLAQPKQNWRTQFSFKLNAAFTIKSRVEAVWVNAQTDLKEQGFLYYIDVSCNPQLQPWSGSMRFLYFETESYNSRLYAFENDVLFSYSIPVFYDKGQKLYINFNYNVSKKLTIWAKAAQTFYCGKNAIGSGLDYIAGSKKTEIKLQVMYKF